MNLSLSQARPLTVAAVQASLTAHVLLLIQLTMTPIIPSGSEIAWTMPPRRLGTQDLAASSLHVVILIPPVMVP